MDKELKDKISSLEVGETLDVKIKCVEDKDNNCEGCIFGDDCLDIDCQRNNVYRKYIVEL